MLHISAYFKYRCRVDVTATEIPRLSTQGCLAVIDSETEFLSAAGILSEK